MAGFNYLPPTDRLKLLKVYDQLKQLGINQVIHT